MVTGIFGEAKLECRLSTKSSQRSRPTTTTRSEERKRERETHTCMHTVDKGLLASRQVERGCLGGFTRLRTPLGLVMRRLSADCDRETGCIPQCHLVLGGYVGSDRRVLIAYHDIYLLSLCFPLSIRSSFSPLRVHVSIHLPNSSCCSYLLLDAAHLLYPLSLSLSLSLGYQVQVILGATWVGCLTRRTRNTSSKVGQDLK